MNDVFLKIFFGMMLFTFGFSFSLDYVYGLSEGDKIRNEFCEFKKNDNPDYDCTIIRDSYSSHPFSQLSSSQSTSEQFVDSKSNSLMESNSNLNSDDVSSDGILSIIVIVFFLIITPIALVQVWRNHNPKKRTYTNSSTQHHEDEMYEKFQQRQKERDEERRRHDQYQREQRRQQQEQQEHDEEKERSERKKKKERERSKKKKQKDSENYASSNHSLQKYYDLLRVKENATPSEIKTAYRKQIKFYHPDNYQNRTQEIQKDADEKTQEILDAYDKLKAYGKVD